MSEKVDINVEYLTRVEGHGNIVVNAQDGNIEKCEWQVIEAPRFFESLVMGRSWKEVHHITSRICGICSIAHTLASLKATEAALRVEVSEQDTLLRKLALHGENIQSHILHLGYLALPDFMESDSILPLISSNEEEVKTVIRIHRLANYMSELIGGRTTHPQRLIPGGFSKIPSEEELRDLRGRLEDSVDDLKSITELLKSLMPKLPDFSRETEFISITSGEEYPFYDGKLASTDTGTAPVEEYLDYTNEYMVSQSTAKYTKHNRESYMVGALARLNNNYDKLSPMAKETAEMFDLKPITCNPFMNNIAQLVEVVHNVEDSMDIIDELLERGLKPQDPYHQPDISVSEGRGVGVVEAPRGTLFHDYVYDEDGICTEANAIIPTNQNHGNIQRDMEELVPRVLDKSEDEIELTLEMLVRAYDPCISCSTHYLDVEFV